ncbi:RidA family protein [Candidatus Latescibacterota bacterium]
MKSLLYYLLMLMIIFTLSFFTGCGENSIETDLPEAQDVVSDVDARLEVLGIRLSTPAPPVANFVHAVRSGNLVFLAGHGPRLDDGTWMTGKVGRDIGIEEGQKAARITGINILSSLKAEIGDLNKVKRIVKVLGMVNSDESFTEQPSVMNGFSDLMVSVFGPRGKHARSAVGMASLPFGIPCEIEMIVEIEDE